MSHVAPGVDPLSLLIREEAQPFQTISAAQLPPLLEQIGDARVVLLGEASHGTHEFYRMRAHITRLLIDKLGFNAVCIEGDWPDAAEVNAWSHGRGPKPAAAFKRFPTWMWRNREVRAFYDFLRNREDVSFYGLDLYSLFKSMHAVIGYLEHADPKLAAEARERYECLAPFRHSLELYGHRATFDVSESCERDAVEVHKQLGERREELEGRDRRAFFDAEMNAKLVVDAERYYRAMFVSAERSWNVRDLHMLETLDAVLAHLGPKSKAVVWAHNSHVGDARFTAQGWRLGEITLGQLARERFGERAALVGFGTHTGTVAAAEDWDHPMRVQDVRPSLPNSIERLCHDTEVPAFLLGLRRAKHPRLIEELTPDRLQRAIGVVYRPATERWSHYYEVALPLQLDAYIWFDETRAVTPIDVAEELISDEPVPETFPTGL